MLDCGYFETLPLLSASNFDVHSLQWDVLPCVLLRTRRLLPAFTQAELLGYPPFPRKEYPLDRESEADPSYAPG